MPEVHARRREALRERLCRAELDALVVTDLSNVRYLTGFTGSNAALLVLGEQECQWCTDGRYRIQARQEVPDLPATIERRCALRMAEYAHQLGVRRLGFESHVMTVAEHAALVGATEPDWLSPTTQLVEELRQVKDADELRARRAACAITDRALGELIAAGGMRPGRTERQVARDLEALLIDGGAEEVSFETILATGVNSAIPHHRPTAAVLARGDLVKLDFGAVVDGYHSDMTRTVALGEPTPWQREIYELVAAAQAAGCVAARSGIAVAEVDAAARSVITDAGYGESFPHGLGHGVGLRVHEAPLLSQHAGDILAAGMAITVEPGVYLADRGGVRIEDTLVVTDDEPELLTRTTKDFVTV